MVAARCVNTPNLTVSFCHARPRAFCQRHQPTANATGESEVSIGYYNMLCKLLIRVHIRSTLKQC